MDNELLNPNQIRQFANSFQTANVLLTAFELEIFSVLDKKMMRSDEISAICKTDHRATDRLLNALTGLGFVKKIHGKFYNSESASKYLVKNKPDFMSSLYHSIELWNNWGSLKDAVIQGKRVQKNKSSSGWLSSFIEAMHYRAKKEASIISMMLDLSNTKKMLDVGAGSGAFSMAFIEKHPSISALLFDLPDVIELTKNYVDSFHLKENISFIEGNYLDDDFGDGYDLILLSAIVHINSFDENARLIKKCCESLNCGGQIVIKDWVMNESRTEPAAGALFSLNMLVSTDSGDTFTESEMRSWFLNAGIQKVEFKNTSFGNSIVVAYK
jgi:ubiquinone/menaquinone biosynthesis C-methylase UbiE